jgi:hypothetical protein
MEKETIENNVQGVCLGCIEDEIKKFNENLPDVKPGDYVKVMFGTGFAPTEGPPSESMWIEVEEVKADSYVGTLDNTPFFIPKSVIKLGDQVEAKMSQCWGHLKPKK